MTVDAAGKAWPERPVLAAIARGPGHVAALMRAIELLCRARGHDVVLVHLHQAGPELGPGSRAWLEEMLRSLNEIGIQARAHLVTSQSIAGGLREAFEEIRPSLLLMDSGGHDSLLAQPYFNVLLRPPCPSVLVHGDVSRVGDGTVLLASTLSGGVTDDLVSVTGALLSRGDEEPVSLAALSVAPRPQTDGAVETYRRQVEERLSREGAAKPVSAVAVQSNSLERGVLRAVSENGFSLVVVDTPERGVIPGLGVRSLPTQLLRRSTVPLLLLTPARSRGAERLLWFANLVYGLVPNLSEAEKVEIYAEVRRAARGTQDFFAMLAMSVAIAALGLLLGSTAVVIGAMLVAPLMIPAVAVGLSVVQGDHRLLQISAGTIVRAVLAGLGIAALAGYALGRGDDPTAEYLARTEVVTLDILIALFSGAAATYAICRRHVLAALPGAAVAVALVPPLATVGIALSRSDWSDARGAGLLFAVNLNAVAVASVVMFLWLGFRPVLDRYGRVGLLARSATVLVSAFVVVVAFVLAPGER